MRKEEMLDKKMPETIDGTLCARVGDLVAFLYGEANETEVRSFQNHVNDCTTCRSELAAFGDVREGIGVWRDDALSSMAAKTSGAATARNAVMPLSGRSALGALREFFALSPLWLRGATAFASLLFVALLFVTAQRYFESSKTRVAQQRPSVQGIKSENPNDGTLVNGGTQEVPVVITPASNKATSPEPGRNKRTDKVATPSKSKRRDSAPSLSNEERSQLLDGLIAENDDEESVPRLYDLLSESN